MDFNVQWPIVNPAAYHNRRVLISSMINQPIRYAITRRLEIAWYSALSKDGSNATIAALQLNK